MTDILPHLHNADALVISIDDFENDRYTCTLSLCEKRDYGFNHIVTDFFEDISYSEKEQLMSNIHNLQCELTTDLINQYLFIYEDNELLSNTQVLDNNLGSPESFTGSAEFNIFQYKNSKNCFHNEYFLGKEGSSLSQIITTLINNIEVLFKIRGIKFNRYRYKGAKQMNILHITHTDLDGISCRLLVSELAKSYEVDYFPIHVDYDELNIDFIKNLSKDIELGLYEDNLQVIITDLGLTEDLARQIDTLIGGNKNVADIRLYDHHVSGLPASKEYDWYYLDIKRSATLIVYDELISRLGNIDENERIKLAMYTSFVNVYDNYHRDSIPLFEAGSLINKLVHNKLFEIPSIFKDIRFKYGITYIREVILENIIELFALCDLARQGKIAKFAMKSFDNVFAEADARFRLDFLEANNISTYNSYTGLAKFLEEHFDTGGYPIIDINGHKLLILWDLPKYDIKSILDIQMYEKHQYDAYMIINSKIGTAGIYAKKDGLNVGKIASLLGGGGHYSAAGCKNKALITDKFDTEKKADYYKSFISNLVQDEKEL